MENESNQTPNNGDVKKTRTAARAVGKGLLGAWRSASPYLKSTMIFGAGAVTAGFMSIHFYNNETDVIHNVFNPDDITVKTIDDDTRLLTRGDTAAIVYKGVSCPLVMDWPRETTLKLGNTGDASLTPTEDAAAAPLSTILGSLGVTRNVEITDKPVTDAQALMNDFYEYATNCNDRIKDLQSQQAQTQSGQRIAPDSPSP